MRFLPLLVLLAAPALAQQASFVNVVSPYAQDIKKQPEGYRMVFLRVPVDIQVRPAAKSQAPILGLTLSFPDDAMTGFTRVSFLKLTSTLAVQCFSLKQNQAEPFLKKLMGQRPQKKPSKMTLDGVEVVSQTFPNGTSKLQFSRAGTPGKAKWKSHCTF